VEKRLSRHAHLNAGASRDRDDRFPDAGECVDVTVSVDVSEADAERPKPGELGAALDGDVVGCDPTREGPAHEL